MKILKFAPDLVPLVLSGEKTSTWRLFDDKDLSVGDDMIFINSGTNEEFAKAKINSVIEKKLGEITDDDFSGHEKFESKEKMFETYREYYGDKVDEETLVKILNFDII